MKSGEFILEWNCFKTDIRTNNSLECQNSLINGKFGSHPFLFKFIFLLAEYFQHSFIAYEQFQKFGKSNPKKKKEITKEKSLIWWWDFISKNKKDGDILLFLDATSKIMKSK